jgi:glycosyltransferase involved in cell wall biosynthesis
LPRLLLVHHFFHPDDVASARLYTDLAVALRRRGWQVTALTSDRTWSDPDRRLPETELYEGVRIERVHRPAWKQSGRAQRLANSGWLTTAWALRAATLEASDAVVIGSDPAFAVILAGRWRRLWPKAAIAHWCHDVYPEAIEANGATATVRALAPAARRLVRASYRRCDALVDLGPEMRRRLEAYESDAVRATIPPWAMIEPSDAPSPPDRRVRAGMFGEAELGLLYSGGLGRAHDVDSLMQLARSCRRRFGGRVAFCFACGGHGVGTLRAAIRADDSNVRVIPPSGQADVRLHLEAADLHLASLRVAWAGVSVPSKFFAALALGRPVVYAGSARSDVAHWVRELGVGYELRPETVDEVTGALGELARSPDALRELQRRARHAYDAHFRREIAIGAWDGLLRSRIEALAAPQVTASRSRSVTASSR